MVDASWLSLSFQTMRDDRVCHASKMKLMPTWKEFRNHILTNSRLLVLLSHMVFSLLLWFSILIANVRIIRPWQSQLQTRYTLLTSLLFFFPGQIWSVHQYITGDQYTYELLIVPDFIGWGRRHLIPIELKALTNSQIRLCGQQWMLSTFTMKHLRIDYSIIPEVL